MENEIENNEVENVNEELVSVETQDTEVVEDAQVDNEGVEVERQETEDVQEQPEIRQQEPDIQSIVKERVDRLNRSHERELDKYKKLETYSLDLFGAKDIEDLISKIEGEYRESNKQLPNYQSALADRDTLVLAEKDASEIINLGELEVKQAYSQLRNIPEYKKSKRDIRVEELLFENLNEAEQRKELLSKGADKEIIESEEYNSFKKMFSKDADAYQVYQMYLKQNQKIEEKEKTYTPPPSLKSNKTAGDKDFYTQEEYMKLTRSDFERNPKLLNLDFDNKRNGWYYK